MRSWTRKHPDREQLHFNAMPSKTDPTRRVKSRISLRRGEIYEIILSTYNKDKRPNAAPMGIKFLGNNTISIQFYKGSQTLDNVLTRRCAVANLTHNPLLFYITTLKRKDSLPSRLFSKAKSVDAPSLKRADGNIEMRLTRSISRRGRVLVQFKIVQISLGPAPSLLYSRGVPALIESTIHATRIRRYLAEGKKEKAARLIQLVNHYKDVIERVCPDSDYARAIRELQSEIDEWKSRSIR